MSNKDDPIGDVIGLTLIAISVGFLFIAGMMLVPVVAASIIGYGAYRRWRSSPKVREREAREHTLTLYEQARHRTGMVKTDLTSLVRNVPSHYREPVLICALELLKDDYVGDDLPPPPAICNSIEGARYRDYLSRVTGSSLTSERAARAVREAFSPVLSRLSNGDSDLSVRAADLLSNYDLYRMVRPLFRSEIVENGLFRSVRVTLDNNLEAAGGVLPSDYDGADGASVYFKDTPFYALLQLPVPFVMPEMLRLSHHHIVGGSGHGKTQCIQYLIHQDILDANTVVVIDSQGDLIRTVASLDIPPERFVLIDPTDIAYPVALNLFDVGMERINQYSPLEREKSINSIIELYDFVLGSLMAAEMTSKQATAFRFVTRLMLHIPNATIHTFRELFEPGGYEKYQQYTSGLSPTAQSFFESEFTSRQFTDTKAQVLRRLYAILENQTFERMFSHPRSKLSLFDELQTPAKIILINTAKDLLKEEGTSIFGRFFIAMIAQAAQERAAHRYRQRTIVYIDECQEYADEKIEVILSQARKYNVGMVLAHQYLGQLSPPLQASVAANTAIKYAGGVSSSDAHVMARHMGCTSEDIMRQPKGTFMASFRGEGTYALTYPLGYLERQPTRPLDELRAYTRARYCTSLDPDRATAVPTETEEPLILSEEAVVDDDIAPVDWEKEA